MVGLPKLRPYQLEIGRAIYASVWRRRGRMFTVEIARQGGKNELSAQLGVLLLLLASGKGGRMVKAAPTFNPQALVSLRRLQDRLDDGGFAGKWRLEGGNIVRLERSQQTFLSAEPTSNVVGATADVLLELDEAQDVERDKFLKEFRPMGATGNATTVLYGTPWDGGSLLETMSEENRELERKDGVRRDFRFDWEAVAACSPLYGRYVESERERLGEEHPLFRTQYRLLPIAPGEGMFNRSQLALLRGGHARLRGPLPGRVYVAGVDVAGEPWGASPASSTEEAMRRASGEPWGATPFEFPQGRLRQAQGERIGGTGGEYGRTPFDRFRANGFGGRVRRVRGRPFDKLRANGGGRGRVWACAEGRSGRDGGDDWRGGGWGAVGCAERSGCGALPVDGGAAPRADAVAGGAAATDVAVPAGGGGRDRARHGGCERAGEGDGRRGGAVRVHGWEQVAAGVRAAGGREYGSGERVRGGWVFGVRGVLARDGAGAGSVPGEPDDGLLCGGVSGARRLSDEPGADGAGVGKPGSDCSREGVGDSPILTFPRGGKGSGGSSWWGPLTRDGSTRGHDDYLMSLALMVLAGGKPGSHRSREGG